MQVLYMIHHSKLTDAVNHAGKPIFFEAASAAILSYTELICLEAGIVLGFACAALTRAFNGSESFDILALRFVDLSGELK